MAAAMTIDVPQLVVLAVVVPMVIFVPICSCDCDNEFGCSISVAVVKGLSITYCGCL